jgi:D-alanine-D-alanine ligase-like ATP-grasp enzyme
MQKANQEEGAKWPPAADLHADVCARHAVANVYPPDDHLDDRQLLQRELSNAGFRVTLLGPFLIAKSEFGSCWVTKGDTSFQSATAARLFKQKILTRRLLKGIGIATAQGRAFKQTEADKARSLVAEFGRAVVKPTDGAEGRGVSVNVDERTFAQAWKSAWKTGCRRVLVERFVTGHEARYFVLDGRCAAVVHRIPPCVTGDGFSSVAELVEARNAARAVNPHLKKKPFVLNEHHLLLLKMRGLDAGYVPGNREKLVLDFKGNLSAGAESEDITDDVHPDYKRIAERLTDAVDGCHAIGIDMIAEDYTRPATSNNYVIVEANTYPNLLGHHYPMYGARRNVYKMLAESCMWRLKHRATVGTAAPHPLASSPDSLDMAQDAGAAAYG